MSDLFDLFLFNLILTYIIRSVLKNLCLLLKPFSLELWNMSIYTYNVIKTFLNNFVVFSWIVFFCKP